MSYTPLCGFVMAMASEFTVSCISGHSPVQNSEVIANEQLISCPQSRLILIQFRPSNQVRTTPAGYDEVVAVLADTRLICSLSQN